MASVAFTFFDTAIGRCSIAWGEQGIVGVWLPEPTERATRRRLLRRFPEAREAEPPAAVARAMNGIVALLRGEPADLTTAPLDLGGVPEYHRRVFEITRRIPPGATLSYGEIASRLGEPGSARAVGQALGKNPIALLIPCHRVLGAGGKLGGFSASGGVATKLRLLEIERARVGDDPTLFDAVE